MIQIYPFTRHACYSALKDVVKYEDSDQKTCFAISGSQELCKIIGIELARIEVRNYPEVSLGNLKNSIPPADFIVCDFVIEHAECAPMEMFIDFKQSLKENGYIILTSAFVYPYHACPNDYWRFSSETYKLLCRKSGLKVIQVGHWGSIHALNCIEQGKSDEMIEPNHDLYKIANECDERYQIVTWIVAKNEI